MAAAPCSVRLFMMTPVSVSSSLMAMPKPPWSYRSKNRNTGNVKHEIYPNSKVCDQNFWTSSSYSKARKAIKGVLKSTLRNPLFLSKLWITLVRLNFSSIKYSNVLIPPLCLVSLVLSRVWLFVNPWTIARQPSLSITNARTLLKLTSIESVMPSNHLILCRPLLLLPSIFPSIRVFSFQHIYQVTYF